MSDVAIPQADEVRRYGVERDVNPFTALLDEVKRSAGHVAWLSAKIADAPTDDDLLETWSPWLRLYRAERGSLVRASETAIKLGLDERMVRVEERRAEMLARVLLDTLEMLDLPLEVRMRAPAVLRERLLALEVGVT